MSRPPHTRRLKISAARTGEPIFYSAATGYLSKRGREDITQGFFASVWSTESGRFFFVRKEQGRFVLTCWSAEYFWPRTAFVEWRLLARKGQRRPIPLEETAG